MRTLLASLALALTTAAILPGEALARSAPAAAALPEAKTATWVARDFRFHTGETMAAMTVADRTVGSPRGSASGGCVWLTRRLIIDSVRSDPDYKGGDYTVQPRSLQFASVFYAVATNGGNQALVVIDPCLSESANRASVAIALNL